MTARETVDTLEDRRLALVAELEEAREAHRLATEKATAFDARAREEWDPAMGSGIRRKPNAKAERARWARFEREGEMWLKARSAAGRVKLLEFKLKTLGDDDLRPFTEEEWKVAKFVRDEFGWHSVVRVNAKSVTVPTGYSWTERILRQNVLQVRA